MAKRLHKARWHKVPARPAMTKRPLYSDRVQPKPKSKTLLVETLASCVYGEITSLGAVAAVGRSALV